MTLTEHMIERVDAFFERLPQVPDDYRHSTFSYVAAEMNGRMILLRGMVILGTDATTALPPPFSTARVRAGCISLASLGRSVRELIDQVVRGGLDIGDMHLEFPAPAAPGSCSVWPSVEPEPPPGHSFWRRETLGITGAERDLYFRHPDLFWELRRNARPFNDLTELALAYGLDGLHASYLFEVVSPHLAEIDNSSNASNGVIDLVVKLAPAIRREPLSITYRAFQNGEVMVRDAIDISPMNWSEEPNGQIGRVQLPVPAPVAAQFYVTYGSTGQHTTWIVDRYSVYNDLRDLYELADANLEKLRKFLFVEASGKHQKQLESTVGCLAWMMGFTVGHIGGVPEVTDFADLLLTTSSGHVVVLECTTGPLKAQNKLSNLYGRRNQVQEALARIDPERRVIGCILTTLSRSTIEGDLEQAAAFELLVVTADELDIWIEHTRVRQSADIVFESMEAELRAQIAMFSGGISESASNLGSFSTWPC